MQPIPQVLVGISPQFRETHQFSLRGWCGHAAIPPNRGPTASPAGLLGRRDNAATSCVPPSTPSCLPGGELWKTDREPSLARRMKTLEARRPGKGDPIGRTGLGGGASAGSSSRHTARIHAPERVSIRFVCEAFRERPGSGASATALAAASDGSRTTSDNYGQYGHLGGFRTG